MSLYAPRQQTARIGSPSRRMFKGGLGGVRSLPYIEAVMSWTPAQVSATSRGYRFNPAAGALVPTAFAGGTVDRLLVLDDDTIQLFPLGGAAFPAIVGGVLIVTRRGAADEIRVALAWDIDHYTATYAGAYGYLGGTLGAARDITLAGAKA
jgi:hypothetical protein